MGQNVRSLGLIPPRENFGKVDPLFGLDVLWVQSKLIVLIGWGSGRLPKYSSAGPVFPGRRFREEELGGGQ